MTVPSTAKGIPIFLLCVFCATTVAGQIAKSDIARVKLVRDDQQGQMQVLVDGKEAAIYRYGADLDLPHLYPIRSPSGKSMTIQHPEKYPHHRSFWFADKVRLEDGRPVEFYGAWYTGESRKDPAPPFKDHVRHVAFGDEKHTQDGAELDIKLVWEMDHRTPVLDELRKMRIVALGNGEYLLDVKFTLTAAHGDVSFVSDAVHYAWPYVRMHPDFSVDLAGGTITNSEGGVNQAGTHGKEARWVDYSARVDGETEGLTVLSHPENQHPHKWLTRDYGTFGPRRIDARSGKPFTLKKGDSLSFRVGILVHRGDVTAGQVAERYRNYAEGR